MKRLKSKKDLKKEWEQKKDHLIEKINKNLVNLSLKDLEQINLFMCKKRKLISESDSRVDKDEKVCRDLPFRVVGNSQYGTILINPEDYAV